MSNQLRAFLLKKMKKKANRPTKPEKPKSENTNKKPKQRKSNFGSGHSYNNRNNDNKFSYNNKNSDGYNMRKERQGNKYPKTDSSRPGLVRFDGYWVKKEAADRLKQMKGQFLL